MRCVGRTRSFRRCRRDARLLCHDHRYQWVWLLVTLLGVIGGVAGIYRDVLVPWRTADEPIVGTGDETYSLVVAPTHHDYYEPWGCEISPDGKKIAFSARVRPTGKRYIFVRRLDDENASRLDSTEGDFVTFFWSADAAMLYFVHDGWLKSTVSGEPAVRVAAIGTATRGSANEDGVILLGSERGVLQVGNGTATPVTRPDPSNREFAHAFPFFLPDGHRFLYVGLRRGAPNNSLSMTLYMGRLGEPKSVVVGEVTSRVEYADGFILYARSGALKVRRFDLKTERLDTAEFEVISDVWQDVSSGSANFSVGGGKLAVKGAPQRSALEVVSFRNGQRRVVNWATNVVGLSVTPDGAKVATALAETSTSTSDIWVWTRNNDYRERVTNGGSNTSPLITPDGRTIYYASDRTGWAHIYRRELSDNGTEQLLFSGEGYQAPRGISPDGTFLTFQWTRDGNSDLYGLSLGTALQPKELVSSPSADGETGRVSPDGHSLLYVSGISGEPHVYVRSLRSSTDSRRISTISGWRARWSSDSSTVFYVHENVVRAHELRTGRESQNVFTAESAILQFDLIATGEAYIVQNSLEQWPRIHSHWTRLVR